MDEMVRHMAECFEATAQRIAALETRIRQLESRLPSSGGDA